MLTEAMGETLEVNGKTLTKAQFIAQKAFQLAASGDLGAIKYITDQTDGAVVQKMEHSGAIQADPVSKEAALAAAKAAEDAGEV